MGLPRKKNYAGRWDVLIDKSTKCLNRMIEIAARKKHNYILDQVSWTQTRAVVSDYQTRAVVSDYQTRGECCGKMSSSMEH